MVHHKAKLNPIIVTILILIDGFLQLRKKVNLGSFSRSHNPYFNRWFSAIRELRPLLKEGIMVTILILIDGFLQ